MNDDKLIQTFFRDYRKMHECIQEKIGSEETKDSLVSRILNRIIIYFFLQYTVYKTNIESLSFEEIMQFKCNQQDDEEMKSYLQMVSSLFFRDSEIENIELDNEVIHYVIKTLSKYKWTFKQTSDEKGITPDLLGKVFEKYINQKENGAYYTEKDTIHYINNNAIIYGLINGLLNSNEVVERMIEIAISNTDQSEDVDACVQEGMAFFIERNYDLNAIFFEMLGKLEDIEAIRGIKETLMNFRVLDITAGTGAFLTDAIDILEAYYRAINSRIHELTGEQIETHLESVIYIVEHNLYGVDIMEDAIEIAKFRLCLYILSECIKEGIQIREDIRFNLKVGNAIVGSIKAQQMGQLALEEHMKKSFCWGEHFPNVIEEGGFGCIVGNPPYVEYSKIKDKYQVEGFETIKCGNIYAFVLERSIKLLKEGGTLGMIVPISIVSTPRMFPLRKMIQEQCSKVFISNYGDRPCTLFNGVHQKLSIVIACKQEKNKQLYTTQNYHWYKDEAKDLFKKIQYIKNDLIEDEFYYKIGNSKQQSIIHKMNEIKTSLYEWCNSGKEGDDVYLNMRLTFWVKCFTSPKASNDFKRYSFETEEEKYVFTAILNSSLFYFVWESISDVWHITNKELLNFKFDYNRLDGKSKADLIECAKKLEADLESKKEYIGSKQTEYEYKHKRSKILIDQIDYILQDYYGFTDEELKEIVDYNMSYRMNDELESYLKLRNEQMG